MTRTIHVALVRVYRSQSCYGERFTAPPGTPKLVRVGDETIEAHFGCAPEWVHRAMGRAPLVAEALLSALYKNDPVKREALDERLSVAERASLAEAKDQWLVALLIRRTLEWDDADVSEARWLWCNNAKGLIAAEKAMKERAPALDLAARAVGNVIPNVFDHLAVRDRVFFSRDDAFADAFGMPEVAFGEVTGSVRADVQRIQNLIAGDRIETILANALAAPAFPSDPTRPDRFKAALRSDLYVDDGGSYGRYELVRLMQPVLMQANVNTPLAAMFVDMNGLKAINDEFGHAAGDTAIAEFRAAVHSKHEGHLFRTGGDEFVIFGLGQRDALIRAARELLEAVGHRSVAGRPLSASVGIVLATNPLEDPLTVIARADTEMYRAKNVSREHTPRRSTMAVEGESVALV